LFKAFFAINPKQVREVVIISPIIYPKQFEKLCGRQGKHYKSILSYLVANFKEITFVKTPMTQAAVYDLVLMLKQTKCKEIVFIGAIGALQKKAKIGDLVALQNGSRLYSFASIHDETQKKLKKLKNKGIIGIDFEAKSFFKAVKKIKRKAWAYFVVTDLPLAKPFYKKKSKKEKESIQLAVQRLIKLLLPFCKASNSNK